MKKQLDALGLRCYSNHTYHLKDWSDAPQQRYRVLLGEGIGRWKELLALAETVGGVEYYLIEQEGSRFPQMETAKRSLENFKAIRPQTA